MDLTQEQRDRLADVMVGLFPDYARFVRFMGSVLDYDVEEELVPADLSGAIVATIDEFEPENEPRTDLRRLLVGLLEMFPTSGPLRQLVNELGFDDRALQAILLGAAVPGRPQSVGGMAQQAEMLSRATPLELSPRAGGLGARKRDADVLRRAAGRAEPVRRAGASARTRLRKLLAEQLGSQLAMFVAENFEILEHDFDSTGSHTEQANSLVSLLKSRGLTPSLWDKLRVARPELQPEIDAIRGQWDNEQGANEQQTASAGDQARVIELSSGRQGGPRTRPVSPQRIAEMISALDTLERLRMELDGALRSFVETQTNGADPDIGPDDTVEVALENVLAHAQDIKFEDDGDIAYRLLHQLLIDVMAAIDMAEQSRQYDVVRQLAKEAGSACQWVATQGWAGGEQVVLASVVPYWRMKEVYAEHQPKIRRTDK